MPHEDKMQQPQDNSATIKNSIPTVLLAMLACFWCEPISCLDPIRVGSQSLLHQTNHQHQCPNGAPIQWRPYLDTSSKAYLAPIVVLASLKEFTLSPIPLSGGSGSPKKQQAPAVPVKQQQQQPSQPFYHPQDINNAGVNIYATFTLLSLFKSRPVPLIANSTIQVAYRVSASLSTTTDLMQLAKSNTLSAGSSLVESPSSSATTNRFILSPLRQQAVAGRSSAENQFVVSSSSIHDPPVCSLELNEHELEKKVSKLFKKQQNYILFLDQQQKSAPLSRHNHNHHSHQQSAVHYYYPFATHEPLNNHTRRALRRISCKNCAQVPQIQLLNSTYVSSFDRPPAEQTIGGQKSARRGQVRLDCRVTGFPTPWIQWFRNGKLLRNRAARYSMRTNKWKKKHNILISRLEIDLGDRNETAIYECRAMNVVAREPAVGAYTLLDYPSNYALIPMQPPLDQSGGESMPANRDDRQQLAQAASITGPATSGTTGKGSPVAAGNNQSPVDQQQPARKADKKVEEEDRSATISQQQPGNLTTQRPTTSVAQMFSSSTLASSSKNHQANSRPDESSNNSRDPNQENKIESKQQQPAPVVGQSCPPGIHDTYCMNKGICVLIGHIDEFYCNCPEGYEGHRCESKSFGHKKAPH